MWDLLHAKKSFLIDSPYLMFEPRLNNEWAKLYTLTYILKGILILLSSISELKPSENVYANFHADWTVPIISRVLFVQKLCKNWHVIA